MPLHLYIKPNEKLIIGDAVVVNGPRSTTMTMLSRTPILREKHILTEEQADTPLKRLQFLIQAILLSEGSDLAAKDAYDTAVLMLSEQAPMLRAGLADAQNHLEAARYYKALQAIRMLRNAYPHD
jgi:flagellar protein FlbT